MFLYAELVMRHLYALETKDKLMEELRKYGFPHGLEDAYVLCVPSRISERQTSLSTLTIPFRYKRILNRMSRTLEPEQWRIACQLLGWMVCAKRPLRWHEIQAARSINTKAQTFDFQGRKLRNDIQVYCGSLIQILPGGRVELIHTTAKM